MQILSEIVGVKYSLGICLSAVLQANRRAAFIVQVDNKVVAPCLADDLGAVQSINVVCTVDDLIGANTIGVVEELDYRVGFLHLLELPAVPVLPLPAEKNTLRTFGDKKLMLPKKSLPKTTIAGAYCGWCFVHFPAIIANIVDATDIDTSLYEVLMW